MRHYSLSSKDKLPTALLSAIRGKARFCVVGRQGYAAMSLKDIEACNKRLYWVPISVHDRVGRLLDRIPGDVLGIVDLDIDVSVFPGKAKGERARLRKLFHSPWSDMPLRDETIGSYGEFLDLIGVELVMEEVGGRLAVFVDAGHYLGSWISGLIGRGEGIDIHHRFAQLLIDRCQGELSEFAEIRLSQLLYPFLADHLLMRRALSSKHETSDDVTVHHKALFDVLKRDGVLGQEEAFPEQEEWPSPTHQCPYGDHLRG